ncbi:hypothetical protein AAC03nite_26750 [Alicyclobacillus acidoterrestris]|nr:hypothetical protein AAC03nite_26750 [Alicyclobacillus acidoterrestris]
MIGMPERKPEMGKWLLYQFFRRNEQIAKFLPETKKYTVENFGALLGKYKMVYVKPVAGSQGKGIMKAWYDGKSIVVQHTVRKQRKFPNVKSAAKYIDNLRDGKMYIVQQGIQLAKIGGRPMDIRVMMQREKPGGRWRYSGMIAKIAGGNSVVTNTALSGGRVMDVDSALQMALGWTPAKVKRTVTELERLGYLFARHFDTYQRYHELGFDVAISSSGRIWLLEQNTAPSHALFARNKKNLALYKRIQYRFGVYERARKAKHA